ncbi:L-seryl-tRNA(Sec) kinase isoform X2 [Plectropomus leopardus]|uniref:L-seryl-tRNA(Sec) kinase isoform X2 n=1 Tax=Plectropomus leopardus TaxID=160734 RepID=UPI001C4C0756|nr:L-seryl-tRNA(Sec) kinase isoform X2 [Plectropomus leopardus]
MAAEEAGVVCRAAACLCVLCGLPAAGKSTLARNILSSAAQHGWRACVVPYDDLIPVHAFQTKGVVGGVKLQETHTEWKLHRQALLRCMEQFLEKPQVLAELPSNCQINRAAWEKCIQALLQPEAVDCSQADQAPLLFLLDDNFYYPSMRYEVYQLARKYSLGFCQMYLQCDLESCISRNQSRSAPIPTEVILDMVTRLEPPNPQKNSWEANSISLNTTDDLSKCDIQRVMELISSALNNPLSPAEDNTEQKADRLRCATSVVHQTDQACRRHISEAMKTARENQLTPELMRTLAAQLNESKATFLQNLRKQLLQEASLTQEEDIDVERLVKRAADVFDREKKEILLRIKNDNR